jgi:hypothetical protein
MKKVLALYSFLVGMSLGHAACPSTPTQQRYNLSGAEVSDRKTGLTWARCSAGQRWDGTTCAGPAATYSRAEADVYVKSQSGWRLPTNAELKTILELSCVDPAIDSLAFPATPTDWYWSDSPDVTSTNFFRHVYFYGGKLKDYNYRDYYYHVRLVKADRSQ